MSTQEPDLKPGYVSPAVFRAMKAAEHDKGSFEREEWMRGIHGELRFGAYPPRPTFEDFARALFTLLIICLVVVLPWVLVICGARGCLRYTSEALSSPTASMTPIPYTNTLEKP